MASWTYQKPNSFSGSNGVGIVVSIAAHIVVIVLALTFKTPRVDNAPAPISVRTLSSDTVETQILEPVETKPRFDRPPLTIAQPDIAMADAASALAPANVASATHNQTAAPTAITMPQFDADYLNNPAPKYPPLSRRLREEGVVLVRVYVLPSGLPEHVELKRSSGSARLDDSALDAVRKWRFVPARRGDDTVAAWVVVPVAFSLTV